MRENGRSGLRAHVLSELRPRVAAFAVENVVDTGTPDVHCTLGWIELKIGSCPVRSSTRVDFDMRLSQRVWHRRWREFGGRSWTLCRLDDRAGDLLATMMHDGHWSAEKLGETTVDELRAGALSWWSRMPTASDMIEVMMRPLPRVK